MDWTVLHDSVFSPGQARPFLGDVACGLFGIAEDYEEAFLSLDTFMVKNKEATYFLRASGNSMAPLIMPQDILVVDRSVKICPGQIVVLTLEGERLCKRLIKESVGLCLHSENPKFRPISINSESDLIIFGPVVGLVRQLR